MTAERPTLRFYLWLVVAGLITFVIHEGAHWLMGTGLGYEMSYGLNGSTPSTPASVLHHTLISAAGPLITILQAIIAFVIVRSRGSLLAYAFLFIAAFMRAVAMGLSLILPNDEARISTTLGLGMWTLPAVVAVGLIALTVVASRRLRLSWKTNVAAYLGTSLTVSAIVGLDMVLK
jgi:hypothetical protein